MLALLMFTIYLASTQFENTGYFIVYNLKVFARATTLPFVFLSPMVLLFTIVLVNNSKLWLPKLDKSLTDLWRSERTERTNAVLLPTRGRYFGLSYTFLLLLTVPTFASFEEIIFRNESFVGQWPMIGRLLNQTPELVFVVLWSIIGFGLIHLFSGVAISEALVLGFVGGLYFSVVYRYFGGLPASVVAHASYNIWAIGFMVSPDFRIMVSKMLRTSAEVIVSEN